MSESADPAGHAPDTASGLPCRFNPTANRWEEWDPISGEFTGEPCQPMTGGSADGDAS